MHAQKFKEFEVNLTLFYYLLDSRKAAVAYMTSMKDLMTEGDSIINIYKKEFELLEYGQKQLLPSFQSKPEDWNGEVIKSEINVLKQILKLEMQAIELMHKEIELKG